MILCQVCEDRIVKLQRLDTVICKSLTAYFHDNILTAERQALQQNRVQIIDIGGRVRETADLLADVEADCANIATFSAKLIQHLVKQKC